MGEKLKVGDICILDPDNNLNLSGNNMTYVKILDTYPSLLGTQYKCIFCTSDGVPLSAEDAAMVFSKHRLTKYHGETVVIRYPKETPIVKKEEVEVLKQFYKEYKEAGMEDRPLVEKLILKLELFAEIVHEY